MPLFTEMPPMLRGTAEEQTLQLRNYLVRLAKSLGGTTQPIQSQAQSTQVNGAVKTVDTSKQLRAEIQRNAQELQQLILSTANNVTQYTDRRFDRLTGEYVAQSEFGDYKAVMNTTIEQTAKNTVESYNFQSQINANNDSIQLLQQYYSEIDGEIRRGIITVDEVVVTRNPDGTVTRETVTNTYIGIAISQSLRFTGEVDASDSRNPKDGYKYYEIAEGQTFGLYTSKGWQFWINGVKKGWFDSQDGLLHVSSMDIEDQLTIGGLWAIRCNSDGNEFELFFIGADND